MNSNYYEKKLLQMKGKEKGSSWNPVNTYNEGLRDMKQLAYIVATEADKEVAELKSKLHRIENVVRDLGLYGYDKNDGIIERYVERINEVLGR